uniref:Uncharacterized protein n=1 Tax=Amphora coffeiformis TaxID=265554 RepID=A0A7S3P4P9_9STRA|eukprot:scaffold6007_cov183-Amphora_coffeaeformis.AAC.29
MDSVVLMNAPSEHDSSQEPNGHPTEPQHHSQESLRPPVGLAIENPSAQQIREQQQQQPERSLEDRLREIEQKLGREKYLEDRVQELETKLSVLSKLLKLQTKQNNNNGSNLSKKQALKVTMSSPAGPQSFKEGGKYDEAPQQGQQQEEQDNLPVRPTTPPPLPISLAPTAEPSPLLSCPQTPQDEVSPQRQQEHHETPDNVPHLESPASFLAKDRESARLSWRQENARPMCPPLDEEQTNHHSYNQPPPPQTRPAMRTLPIFEGVPAAQSHASVFDAPKLVEEDSLRLPESAVAPSNINKGEALTHTKRNLSFSLLYGGDEKAYKQGKRNNSAPPAQTSMTLAERRWLGSLAQSINGERQQIPDDNVRHKWLNYLNSFQESTPDVDVQMEEFIKVPGQVESIMSFGFYICVDSFLYCVTVLPIRFVWSIGLLVNRFLLKSTSPAFTFHRRHSYQMIQVFILYCVHAYVLAPISIGQLYHWIRGQAMIKLYVLIAIVEVFDRLWCAMGQDCLDSMYWNTVNRPTSMRMIISVVVVLVYCTIHTLFLFVHVATLNVAMNSADQALLALLISGNFAEIKSTVFKKYNRPALFKLTAGDICERFKLGLFLSLVLLLNYCQGMERGQFFQFIRTCGMIWGGELLADWIKHSFITKFNFLPARVFVEYSLLLAGDVTGIGHEGVNVDHSHAVVKRIGFAQLPFVCVSFRLVVEAAKYAALNEYWQSLSTMTVYGIFATSWFILLIIKLALGSLLHHISLAKLKAAPEFMLSPKKKKKQ